MQVLEQDCAEFGCLPSEAAAERHYYEPTSRLMDDVRDARMMRRIHEAHTRSEQLPAAQCGAAREHLASAYGRTYSMYLLPPELLD